MAPYSLAEKTGRDTLPKLSKVDWIFGRPSGGNSPSEESEGDWKTETACLTKPEGPFISSELLLGQSWVIQEFPILHWFVIFLGFLGFMVPVSSGEHSLAWV